MKVFFFFCFFLLFSLTITPSAHGIENPLGVPNNRFGIHVVDEHGLEDAAALVNSSGGDWGYVTMVIPEMDRNSAKWQQILDTMRTLHLIPIIRLATTLTGDTWRAPTIEDAATWGAFLSRLSWVTKNRYIIVFNEPNHAKEWGGTIDPDGYTRVLRTFSSVLKAYSRDFFVLPAGLDVSAPNGRDTMDAYTFFSHMVQTDPLIFTTIDGWSSHSYPNPGFAGNVTDRGRGTLRSYQWEFATLKTFGLSSTLPIFITETGWAHQEGISRPDRRYLSADTVAERFVDAADTVWSDSQIVAVVPFLLNYPSYPFSHFSWQAFTAEKSFFPQYEAYQRIPKVAGKPALIPSPTLTRTPTAFPSPTPLPKVLGMQLAPDDESTLPRLYYLLAPYLRRTAIFFSSIFPL